MLLIDDDSNLPALPVGLFPVQVRIREQAEVMDGVNDARQTLSGFSRTTWE